MGEGRDEGGLDSAADKHGEAEGVARDWDSERPARAAAAIISLGRCPAPRGGAGTKGTGGSNCDAPCATDYSGERTPARRRRQPVGEGRADRWANWSGENWGIRGARPRPAAAVGDEWVVRAPRVVSCLASSGLSSQQSPPFPSLVTMDPVD